MVYGIGIDSVSIDRMEKNLENAAFLQRVFSDGERALLAARRGRRRAETAAACFAAKEAFLKAAGTGLGGFALAEIGALRRDTGAPYYMLEGKAAAWCKEKKLTAQLSITHEAGIATAMALLQVQGGAVEFI